MSQNHQSQSSSVQEKLQRAVKHHGAGELDEAEDLYRRVLQDDPKNPPALHLLGVIAHQVGDEESALELISTAVAIEPAYAEAHCNLGLVLKNLGDLEEAVTSYRRAIELQPDHAQAHNNLGNALQALGRMEDAAESYQKALRCEPDYINALSNLGFVLNGLGRLEESVAKCKQALSLDPDHAGAHSNLGLALQAQGSLDAAVASYRKALVLNPDDAEVHNNLGNALQEMERFDEALDNYQNAVALAPEYGDAFNNMGNAFHELERYEDAIASYRAVLDLEPENADAHNNLGLVFQDLGNFENAVSCYRSALAAQKDYGNAHGNLGLALNALGYQTEALSHFDTYLQIRRGPNAKPTGENRFREISRAKIDHDIEQFRYLDSLGDDWRRFGALAEVYEKLRDDIEWPQGNGTPIPISDDQHRLIGESYNRPINRVQALSIPGSSLGTEFDAAEITQQYFENAPGMTYFDGVLSPVALDALRRFLLESTIWSDFRYHRGYLGAFLNDGLACPLLLQIAEDFRREFPDIFKDHKLLQCWAYKYDSRLQGIDVHADIAAVNVNFWVTPDSANLGRGNGGLVVHKIEAPLDWRFKAYNMDQKRIRRFLAENDTGKMVVPHAENRAVFFNSDLFHETDTIEFMPGYENRRINVTMLFGRRQD
jgi:tetratricopeptide (TPR) repeat protein